jgi:hypothetical protein
MEFRLGRSIAQLVPFIKVPANEQKPIITTRLIIIFAIIVIAKIAILLV